MAKVVLIREASAGVYANSRQSVDELEHAAGEGATYGRVSNCACARGWRGIDGDHRSSKTGAVSGKRYCDVLDGTTCHDYVSRWHGECYTWEVSIIDSNSWRADIPSSSIHYRDLGDSTLGQRAESPVAVGAEIVRHPARVRIGW
ncbi:MAG: hypothetical protein OEW45_13585 [Deltaproteobacteria bacterium]|nr:hypothetical protein [Deltaproteobacteria bacterium]